MLRRTALIAALFATAATAAWAAPVRRAGEWRTTIDNGQPLIACFPADATLDQNFVTRTMARLPGVKCTVNSINTVGDVTSYSMQCSINGSVMTSSGTITATGEDAFSSKMHSHGGEIKMPNGRTLRLPDTDMVTVSRRLGPCKPNDRRVAF
jgi:hypothetical protein